MNFHKNHWLLFSFTFFIFIGLSLIIAIFPAIWVQDNAEPMPGSQPLTALEKEGLAVYVSEGCVACHTQQVRPLEMDTVWGRPAAPGDYAHVTPLGVWAPYAPAVLGSERTGPDLTNVGARQSSDVWQYIHLYNPRAVVPDSVMPAYPWLFDRVPSVPEGKAAVPVPPSFAPKDGNQVVPNRRGEALVAYLLALKQPVPPTAAPAAATAEAPAPTGVPGETQAASESAAPAASEVPATPAAPVEAQATAPSTVSAVAPEEAATASEAAATVAPPSTTTKWDTALGEATFTGSCAACHQASGQGLPGAFPPLVGNAVVLDPDPTEHILTVLEGKPGGGVIDGVTYSSPMPPFASQLNDEQIAAVVNHERTSWGNAAPLVTPENVAAARGGTR